MIHLSTGHGVLSANVQTAIGGKKTKEIEFVAIHNLQLVEYEFAYVRLGRFWGTLP